MFTGVEMIKTNVLEFVEIAHKLEIINSVRILAQRNFHVDTNANQFVVITQS
jgi:hypothetical protein